MNLYKWTMAALLSITGTAPANAQNGNIVVKANQRISEIQPTMWGVFFEDINLGADGGMYAELVKNRSFEFYKPWMGWTMLSKQPVEGAIVVQNEETVRPNNPRYISINTGKTNGTPTGISNEGFRGMGIKQGLKYDFSVLYRQQKTGVTLRVELTDAAGKIYGSGKLIPASTTNQWQKQTISFTSNATVEKAILNIWFEGNGSIDLDMISLFPTDTWKGRPGGLRADMVQMLADMKPGFIRFPGGCIVEGHDLSVRYQWKKTIGPVEERKLIVNRWNTEFAHRPTPDYYQTFGLGFFEYFQMAEDMGATALPILNCGMACQFNTAELVPLDELEPYIQDALDLIEFANAPAASEWGKIRAAMGHPAPFHLKMLGVGNENWGPQYIERLKIFTKAIKEKYPDIKIVNSSGTDPEGERFDLLNKELRAMNADIIDEHYYRRPEWFLANAKRYDDYPRNGPKIFAGEYAAQSDKTVSIHNKNNWQTAIAEAAFLTGLERNAAVVNMASYAPLFAHADGWQWTPDLIWVNNLKVYGTPNYYVQKLYSTNKGTHVVPALMNGQPLAGTDSLYASSVTDTTSGELILKLVNASGKAIQKTIQIEGWKMPAQASLTVLKNELQSVNSFEDAVKVSPVEQTIALKKNTAVLTLAPYSMNMLKIAGTSKK